MTDVRKLLDEATPLPWSALATGSEGFSLMPPAGIRGRVGRITEREFDKDKANAALIVHAVNHLPDYEAAVDALDYLIGTWEQGVTPDIEKCRAVLRRLRGET